VLYISQEGRGIGLANKLRAYALQDSGMDTVEANVHLGFRPDEREFGTGAQILHDLGVRQLRTPDQQPEEARPACRATVSRSPSRCLLVVAPNQHNQKYLDTKRDKMGHLLGSSRMTAPARIWRGGKKAGVKPLQGPRVRLEADRPETPDQELIAAVLAGSEAAFGSLVDRYQDRVFRLLGRYCRDQVECEDLAQDVFLKVFRKLHTFQHESAFFTWLYRIAVNAATDHLSRASRAPAASSSKTTPCSMSAARRRGTRTRDNPAAPLMRAELAAVTRQIVDSLPEKYRTILVLREFEDLSYNEIAEVLQMPARHGRIAPVPRPAAFQGRPRAPIPNLSRRATSAAPTHRGHDEPLSN
jgi:RNA polymerase sigma-70 factor (ECF subfamily)